MTLSGSCFWHNLWHSIWRIFWYSFWQLICYLTLGCASELAIERLWRGSNLVYKDWHVTWRWHADMEAGHRVIVVCCVCASFLIRRDVVKSRNSGKKQTISYYIYNFIYILNSRYPRSTSLHAEDRPPPRWWQSTWPPAAGAWRHWHWPNRHGSCKRRWRRRWTSPWRRRGKPQGRSKRSEQTVCELENHNV